VFLYWFLNSSGNNIIFHFLRYLYHVIYILKNHLILYLYIFYFSKPNKHLLKQMEKFKINIKGKVLIRSWWVDLSNKGDDVVYWFWLLYVSISHKENNNTKTYWSTNHSIEVIVTL